MTIKKTGDAPDQAWEVWVGKSRRRLFVWRKLGGEAAALALAKDEELRMKLEHPTLLARAAAKARTLTPQWLRRK